MISRDWIEAARSMTESGPGRPTQARLRRAVSTAYYAMFHCLAGCAANLIIGRIRKPAWHQTYRALEHGKARSACEDRGALAAFPPEVAALPLLRVAPSYGATGRGSGQWTSGSDRPLPGPRLETEMGYGVAALAGVVTPYGGLGLSGDGTHGLRLGARWRVAPGFEWELEGERQVGRKARPGHGLMLRGRMRW